MGLSKQSFVIGARRAPPAMIVLALSWAAGASANPVEIAPTAGEQISAVHRTEEVRFAGKTLSLEDFSGFIGISSEAAYVVVTGGTASDGRVHARPGQMLLIPPNGAATSRAHFDAERLLAGLTDSQKAAAPDLEAQLVQVARGQGRGLFLGRLGRTDLNVAAPGGAGRELAARTVRGEAPIQAIRFSGAPDRAARARQVADAYLAALTAGDARTIAALSDPVPFGNMDLSNGGSDARLLMAQALLEQRDWRALLAGATIAEAGEGDRWSVSSPTVRGTLVLRRMGDFDFVSTFDLGDAQ